MEKAVKLLSKYFVPYINGCLLTFYPYEKCCRPFYHTAYTLEQYEKRCGVQIKDLCKDCPSSFVIDKLLEEFEHIVNGHNGILPADAVNGNVFENEKVTDGYEDSLQQDSVSIATANEESVVQDQTTVTENRDLDIPTQEQQQSDDIQENNSVH
ncbi:unnamed protein product [Gongylonema pulchrum]|uniref:C2H2-type domain-containing protein n=1 Tax=Gongylonema pulchrum TaxID=637853 RepID=A0A183D634_9BILA|nr:unnamed protein product [Gongylonema pulchrum]